MARKWFQLVGADGNALTPAASVSIDEVDLDFFRKAVKVECAITLASVDAICLIVFANKAALVKKKPPLEVTASLAGLGNNPRYPLVVVVPQREVPGEKRQRTEDESDLVAVAASSANAAARILSASDLAALVAAAAKVEAAEVGTLLAMPETALGTDVSHGLFIRQEYKDVCKLIADELTTRPASIRRILVVGSPGIGKSVFGIYMVLVWMNKQRDFAYRALGRLPKYFTWTASGYKVSLMGELDKTYDGFFDGDESSGALELESFKIAYLFASPRTTNHNQFVKTKCFKVYMHPWTRAECQHFADTIQEEDVSEWVRRFNLVGGKPRFLFSETPSYDELVTYIRGSLPQNTEELKEQVRLFQEQLFNDKMKHMLFMFYRTPRSPSIPLLMYASSAIKAMMNAKYQIQSAEEIRRLLQTPAANLQAWRGREMELFLLEGLVTSKFCMRPVEDTGEEVLFDPFNAISKDIQAASEIKNELAMYIPLSKTFPAIDGVLVVPHARQILYAQSTVSQRHPIKYQQLKNVYTALARRSEFQGYTHKLVFVVTPDVYDTLAAQPYRNTDGKVERTQRIDVPVTQYVARIVWDSLLLDTAVES